MTKEISILIQTLRLPLMIAVVFIHCKLSDSPSMPVLTTTERLFSQVLTSPAVPLFMFFAGYLYFINISIFNKNIYLSKLKSRFKSLFIPYILWNLLIILFFGLFHYIFPSMISPDFNNVSRYSAMQLLNCFWGESGGFPIAYQFWFIRDLMLLVLLSPLIYMVVQSKLIKLLILVFTIAFVLTDNHILIVTYYFTLGAFCGIHKIDFIKICRKYSFIALVVALFSLGAQLFLFQSKLSLNLFILSMSACIISSPFWIKETIVTKMARKYSSASFFLFGVHGVMALLLCKFLVTILPSGVQSIWIICYFANVFLIVFIGIAMYFILKKYIPRTIAILTGNR